MSLDFPKILRLQAAGLAIELAAADKPALISIWLPVFATSSGRFFAAWSLAT